MGEPESTWEEAVIWLRSQPGQAELVQACFFDDPLLAACERYRASVEWQEVRRRAGPPAKVLDLGAGRGIASYAFARDGWEVVALEPDPSELVGAGAIRNLKSVAGLAIDVREECGEALPLADDTFDLVFCRQVLHHARDLGAFCREVARVLKPGGRMLAVREHVISREADLPYFQAIHPLHHRYGGEQAFTLPVYRENIRAAGLTLIEELNPWASEMNTFPETFDDLRRRVARRLHWPWPAAIPARALAMMGSRIQRPGRLYSFVARKAARPVS